MHLLYVLLSVFFMLPPDGSKVRNIQILHVAALMLTELNVIMKTPNVGYSLICESLLTQVNCKIVALFIHLPNLYNKYRVT